jgi:hypothetical protein
MRPIVAPALVALCLAAPATAQILVGWSESPTNGGTAETAFACQSSAGSNVLVISFVPPVDLPGATGLSLDLRLVTGTPGVCDCFCPGSCVIDDLPAYWDLTPGGCRPGAISAVAGFPGDGGTSAVENPFLGANILPQPFAIEVGQSGPYSAPVPFTFGRFQAQTALPVGTTVDLLAGHEYYVFAVNLPHANSTRCDGCCRSVGFHPTVTVMLPGGAAQFSGDLSGAAAFWQGFQATACSAVPARSWTWGSLKSAYR